MRGGKISWTGKTQENIINFWADLVKNFGATTPTLTLCLQMSMKHLMVGAQSTWNHSFCPVTHQQSGSDLTPQFHTPHSPHFSVGSSSQGPLWTHTSTAFVSEHGLQSTIYLLMLKKLKLMVLELSFSLPRGFVDKAFNQQSRAPDVPITHLCWAPWSLNPRQSSPVLLGLERTINLLTPLGKAAALGLGPCFHKAWHILSSHLRHAVKSKHLGIPRAGSWMSFQSCNSRHWNLNFSLHWSSNPVWDLPCWFLLLDLTASCSSEALEQSGGKAKKLK